MLLSSTNINAVNEHGNTPLHYACFWGHEQVAEVSGSLGRVGGALRGHHKPQSLLPAPTGPDPHRQGQDATARDPERYEGLGCHPPHPPPSAERAEKLGQSLTKIPYKDTFWKGTTRTRPRNGTLNKLAGIDFKQLSLSHKLNENQSGELWKGRWQGNDIVIKMLRIRDWTTRKSRDFNEEYPKLRIFSHPNVLPVLGACQAPPAPHPIVISHWMPYGSLYNVLHEGTNFVVDQMQAVKFAFDIARGMAFLHTLEPLIPRHHLNSRSVMVSQHDCPGRQSCDRAWGRPDAQRPTVAVREHAGLCGFLGHHLPPVLTENMLGYVAFWGHLPPVPLQLQAACRAEGHSSHPHCC
uniref:Protein kinase domain-containing protein n=1 Tax=Zonotrichia albicollis TaxID=44394 RepID=A0A8D2ML77_ZONAL